MRHLMILGLCVFAAACDGQRSSSPTAPSTSTTITATQTPPLQGVALTQPLNAKPATVVATINGGGTAEMQAPLAAGSSTFGIGVKLLSDGSATGRFDCVDQHGDSTGFPGNIFGEVTSWSTEGTVIVLNVSGKFLPIPGGHPGPASFTVKIQQFGGAGVGHWTLEDTASGFIFCYEILTSGQIVYRAA